MNDREFDAQFEALIPIEPPRVVQLRVLEAVGVGAEQIATLVGESSLDRPGALVNLPRRPQRLWTTAAVVTALAATALLSFTYREQPAANPSTLVPRGVGETRPALALRVVVRQGDHVERLARGQAYSAGDTLLFRVSASVRTNVVLRRDEVILYQGTVPAGDSDLPIGYTLEAGQAAARFVLEGNGVSDSIPIAGVTP